MIENRRSNPLVRSLTRRTLLGAGAVMGVALLLAACVPPGAPSPTATTPSDVSTTLTSDEITLTVRTSQEGADPLKALTDAFTAQHPNVSFDVTSESNLALGQNARRVFTGDNAPDISFLSNVKEIAEDGILANLDPYAEAFGWSQWSQPLLDMNRFGANGERGTGSLYAVGVGYNVTGVFYNKKIASELGITVPTTFAEFDAAAKKAVDAGYEGLSVAAKDIGTLFLIQLVQNSFGDATEINDWVFQRPGATFDQPAMVKAAAQLQEWKSNGVIGPDALSVDYPTMMGNFQAGKALFVGIGDWEASRVAAALGDDVGFFLMPPASASSKTYAMASPASYVIPASAKNPDAAAYFLNWIHTDETARKLVVDTIGSFPGGPVDLPVPNSDIELIQTTTSAFAEVSASGGAVDFISNATQAIGQTTLVPECQALLLGSITPEQFVANVQKAYETELSR